MFKYLSHIKNGYLWLILILAAGIRIAYWMEVKNEAWFIAPGTDPDYYLSWARDILNGNGSAYFPFPRAPLYPYIIAGIQGLFGTNWLWLRLFNLACDLITVSLIYHMAQSMMDRRAGIIAGVIFSVSGANIYFTGEVLMTSLSTLAMTSIVYSLVTIKNNNLKKKIIFTGLGIGLMAFLRPNILILLPFTTAYTHFIGRNYEYAGYRFKLPMLHFATILIILTPSILVNFFSSGHIIPVSTQGGVNFLIGNVRGADGWSSTLPSAGPSWSTDDAKSLASNYMGKELIEVEVSPALWKMGFEEIAMAPIAWLRIMVKKSLIFVNYREIANNRPFILPLEKSIVLSKLSSISLGAIFPFALLGLFRYRRYKAAKVFGIIAFLYGISIVIFFVTTRYRTPIFPVFALLASFGITEVLNSRKNEKHFFKVMFILLLGGVISYPGWAGSEFDDETQARFIAGNAHVRLGQPELALENFELALSIRPDFYELNLNIGVALLSLEDTTEAEEYFRREILHWQESPKAYNNIGVIREGQSKISDAIRFYKRSLDVNSSFIDARENLGRIYLNAGDEYARSGILDSASTYYRQVILLRGATSGLLHRLAIIELNHNNYDKARQLLRDGLILDPGFTPSLNLLKELNFTE